MLVFFEGDLQAHVGLLCGGIAALTLHELHRSVSFQLPLSLSFIVLAKTCQYNTMAFHDHQHIVHPTNEFLCGARNTPKRNLFIGRSRSAHSCNNYVLRVGNFDLTISYLFT